eukprot:m.125384 g.125384  ORF g.125384 m.125384 type:complete len:523 (-) comp13537_c1_seq1:6963-8531(-)
MGRASTAIRLLAAGALVTTIWWWHLHRQNAISKSHSHIDRVTLLKVHAAVGQMVMPSTASTALPAANEATRAQIPKTVPTSPSPTKISVAKPARKKIRADEKGMLLPDGSVSKDPPTAWGVDDITWDTEWKGCKPKAPHVVYAAASEARAIIVENTIASIGGCGLRVPLVSRPQLGLAIGGPSNLELRYEGKVVMNVTTSMKGNPPNSATHFRLLATVAVSKSLVPDTWVLIFEDDAILHPNATAAYPTAKDRANLLRHTFKMGKAAKADRLFYGHCVSHMAGHPNHGSVPVCHRHTDSTLPGVNGPNGRYSKVAFSDCPHDFRCAHAYAVTQSEAIKVTNAYSMLNAGNQTCPKYIWTGSGGKSEHPRCSADPMITTRYMSGCQGPKRVCKGLVVGQNFADPNAKKIKKGGKADSLGISATLSGLFLQRRGDTKIEKKRDSKIKQDYKDKLKRDDPKLFKSLSKAELDARTKEYMKSAGLGGAKHFRVRMMLATKYVRKFFSNNLEPHEIDAGPPDVYAEE